MLKRRELSLKGVGKRLNRKQEIIFKMPGSNFVILPDLLFAQKRRAKVDGRGGTKA